MSSSGKGARRASRKLWTAPSQGRDKLKLEQDWNRQQPLTTIPFREET